MIHPDPIPRLESEAQIGPIRLIAVETVEGLQRRDGLLSGDWLYIRALELQET